MFNKLFVSNQCSSDKQEEEQDVLIKNLNQLKEQLNQVSSLAELDLLTVLGNAIQLLCVNQVKLIIQMAIGPFLEVIRSEDTSGPVTELALSAVFKFLSYGLIGNILVPAAFFEIMLSSFPDLFFQ